MWYCRCQGWFSFVPAPSPPKLPVNATVESAVAMASPTTRNGVTATQQRQHDSSYRNTVYWHHKQRHKKQHSDLKRKGRRSIFVLITLNAKFTEVLARKS
jgi:hypothetical protein